MSKRKITHQQQRRIQDKQASRQSTPAATLELEQSSQPLGPEQSGLLVRRFGTQVEIEDEQGRLYACHLRQHLPIPVCGDQVIWQKSHDQRGVVIAIKERRTQLVRLDRNGNRKPIAANMTQMIIVIAPFPPVSFLQIDKFLIAAHQLQLKPAIVVNKTDLPEAAPLQQHLLETYQHLNFPIVLASAHQSHELEALTVCLQHEVSILVGQSGVGKSSLIQALTPHHVIQVGDLSQQSGLGTHTTTTAVLYHLPSGGDLIDSPGVRQFNLWPITFQELLAGYPEFLPYLDQCQFRNCQHNNEISCAVKTAMTQGLIPQQRYQNYLTLLIS